MRRDERHTTGSARLRSRPFTPSEETWELRHVPGLLDEIYALRNGSKKP